MDQVFLKNSKNTSTIKGRYLLRFEEILYRWNHSGRKILWETKCEGHEWNLRQKGKEEKVIWLRYLCPSVFETRFESQPMGEVGHQHVNPSQDATNLSNPHVTDPIHPIRISLLPPNPHGTPSTQSAYLSIHPIRISLHPPNPYITLSTQSACHPIHPIRTSPHPPNQHVTPSGSTQSTCHSIHLTHHSTWTEMCVGNKNPV